MTCIEYCKHLVQGQTKNPPWLHYGDFYYNPSDSTYVGFVLDQDQRDFYIPDSIVELDEESFVSRCKPISSNIRKDSEDINSDVLSAEEIESDLRMFYSNHTNS